MLHTYFKDRTRFEMGPVWQFNGNVEQITVRLRHIIFAFYFCMCDLVCVWIPLEVFQLSNDRFG